nr:hypothetical protein [Chlamydiota bacterium]
MWKPLIKCSIVGGVVVFIWYMISWLVLPWHTATLDTFENESAVVSALLANAPKDGIYVIPDISKDKKAEPQPSDNEWNGYQQPTATTPFVFANIVRSAPGKEAMTKSIVIGVIAQMVGAFIVTWLLLKTKAMKYGRRVCFVTVVGLFLGLMSALPMWNWWAFPAGF